MVENLWSRSCGRGPVRRQVLSLHWTLRSPPQHVTVNSAMVSFRPHLFLRHATPRPSNESRSGRVPGHACPAVLPTCQVFARLFAGSIETRIVSSVGWAGLGPLASLLCALHNLAGGSWQGRVRPVRGLSYRVPCEAPSEAPSLASPLAARFLDPGARVIAGNLRREQPPSLSLLALLSRPLSL